VSNKIPGGSILKQVLKSLLPHCSELNTKNGTNNFQRKKVVIIQFWPQFWPLNLNLKIEDYPKDYALHHAADYSSIEKCRTFKRLGFNVDILGLENITKPDHFNKIIHKLNSDESVAALIVQHPVPEILRKSLNGIDHSKDIDRLNCNNDKYDSCATADAISRVVNPFLHSSVKIAIIGSAGFVGKDTVAKMVNILSKKYGNNYSLKCIDSQYKDQYAINNTSTITYLSDGDISESIECDIIISTASQSELLDEKIVSVGSNYQLIVDGAFIPTEKGGDEKILGSLKKSVSELPQNITPVPGGIRPLEMAILAERLVRKVYYSDLSSWSLVLDENNGILQNEISFHSSSGSNVV
jgi:methylenetetrahydrofolate dehydrogenase (NADP+) / methenyltetrahydrofolate cyclohydrolase